jgi:hypothetical protein
VIPEEPLAVVNTFALRMPSDMIFDMMNWSLDYRDEMLEDPSGIWVIRSLGTNGRWDDLRRIIAGQESVPKTFIELSDSGGFLDVRSERRKNP